MGDFNLGPPKGANRAYKAGYESGLRKSCANSTKANQKLLGTLTDECIQGKTASCGAANALADMGIYPVVERSDENTTSVDTSTQFVLHAERDRLCQLHAGRHLPRNTHPTPSTDPNKEVLATVTKP